MNNVRIIHIINLLRIKPAERAYLIENFNKKALFQNLDTTGIAFINTSNTSI
jgi:hypothetical protein